MLTQEMLKKVIKYDKESGVFTWVRNGINMKVGEVAGRINHTGHVQIGIFGKRYQAHRLAWLWMNGCWPKEQIDHINRVRNDNRWVNLRAASNRQNAYNRSLRSDNSTGTCGVMQSRDKWIVRVQFNGVRHSFGSYDDIELAELVAKEARNKYFGEFSS